VTLLWIDASQGAAGDMLLAALVDAGASVDRIRAALAALDVEPVQVEVAEVRRHGLRSLHAEVRTTQAHITRTLPDVLAVIAAARLDDPARQLAAHTFTALAEAEARVHGATVDEVHFHEVGALDTIADVVGCAVALDDLGVLAGGAVVVSTVGVGSGTVRGEHGLLPVPTPAVVELLSAANAPVSGAGPAMELCTPTAAALLTVMADSWGACPPMRLRTSGVGAGTADPVDHRNILRVLVGEPLAPATISEDLAMIETTVDDLEPRLLPGVLDALVRAGALDAWATQAHMRKSRLGLVISALCAQDSLDAVFCALVENSTSLGARVVPIRRMSLRRTAETVEVSGQQISVKCGWLGERLVTTTPEFADVARAAAALGRSERAVLEEANRNFCAQRS
jgi:pyridinium-3,5-bisthiocarboxylic acid mononucleotide nickel chelatase